MNATLLTGSIPTRPRFSFEVFPARSGAAALALGETLKSRLPTYSRAVLSEFSPLKTSHSGTVPVRGAQAGSMLV